MSTNRPSTHAKIFFGLLAALFVFFVWWGFAGGAQGIRAEAASRSAFSCDDAAAYAAFIVPDGISILMTIELELDESQSKQFGHLLAKVDDLSPDIKRLCRTMEAVSSSENLGRALDSFERSLDLTRDLTTALRPELEAFYGSLNDTQKCALEAMTTRHGRRPSVSSKACAAIG